MLLLTLPLLSTWKVQVMCYTLFGYGVLVVHLLGKHTPAKSHTHTHATLHILFETSLLAEITFFGHTTLAHGPRVRTVSLGGLLVPRPRLRQRECARRQLSSAVSSFLKSIHSRLTLGHKFDHRCEGVAASPLCFRTTDGVMRTRERENCLF